MTKANYGAYQALSGIDAVPTFLKIIRNLGGKVYELPRYQKTKESKANIIKYLNQAFSGKIPTGAIIAGCKSQECQGEGSSAHMAILGDKNAQNDLCSTTITGSDQITLEVREQRIWYRSIIFMIWRDRGNGWQRPG